MEPATDRERFYKKGVEFASMAGASVQATDDDYDLEDGTGDPLPAPAPSVSGGATTLTQAVGDFISPTLPLETKAGISSPADGEPGTSEDDRQSESLDSGLGSQTPTTDLSQDLCSQPPVFNVGLSGSAQSERPELEHGPPSSCETQELEDGQQELPDNMSLDELYARVKKLFPGFRPNSILRFSSLLGPGKPSSLPKLWSEARKPPKKRLQSERVELKLDCDFIPPEHMINTDDEVDQLTGIT